jgi:hypothetical protein
MLFGKLLLVAVPWDTYPSDYTIDLFDPRHRQWYVAAATAPKDILFLIDL